MSRRRYNESNYDYTNDPVYMYPVTDPRNPRFIGYGNIPGLTPGSSMGNPIQDIGQALELPLIVIGIVALAVLLKD